MSILIHKAEMIEVRSILKHLKKSLYDSNVNSTVVISQLKLEQKSLLAKVTGVTAIDPRLTKLDSLIAKLEIITKDLERIRVSSVIELSDDIRSKIEDLLTNLYQVDSVLLMEYYLDKSLLAGFSFEVGGKYYDFSVKHKVSAELSL
jgi:F0F1-type ATP synthase delta subunit